MASHTREMYCLHHSFYTVDPPVWEGWVYFNNSEIGQYLYTVISIKIKQL